MNLFQQTKSNQKTILPALVTVMVCAVFLFVPQNTLAATPTTNQIRDTIKAKCNTVLTKDSKKKHGKKPGYQTLTDACKGLGIYEKGAAKKAQRAQRLLDICSNHESYLQEYNAYSSVGVVDGGNCTAIVSNAELTVLTKNLENYPANTFGSADDPALNCTASSSNCDLIEKYINPLITFMSAFVAIGVVIGIISGGIRYTTAGDDAQKVAAARNQIRSAIIALVAYIFLYALIQWILP